MEGGMEKNYNNTSYMMNLDFNTQKQSSPLGEGVFYDSTGHGMMPFNH